MGRDNDPNGSGAYAGAVLEKGKLEHARAAEAGSVTEEMMRRRSRNRRLDALSVRLFGGFKRDLEIQSPPDDWRRWELPREPFVGLEIDREIEAIIARLGSRRRADLELWIVCPYWWVRRTIYALFDEVERVFGAYELDRRLSGSYQEIADLARKTEDALSRLHDKMHDVFSDTEIPDGDERLHWNGGTITITVDELFDPASLDEFDQRLEMIEDQAQRVSRSYPQRAGAVPDIRRHYFAAYVGVIWWRLEGASPKQSNPRFVDFVASAESMFFAGADTKSPAPDWRQVEHDGRLDRDARALADETARRFREWKIPPALGASVFHDAGYDDLHRFVRQKLSDTFFPKQAAL